MNEGLLSIISAGCGQLVKMLITFVPHGIFDYIYILIGRENGKENRKKNTGHSVSPSVRGQLVKMLIILEHHGVF